MGTWTLETRKGFVFDSHWKLEWMRSQTSNHFSAALLSSHCLIAGLFSAAPLWVLKALWNALQHQRHLCVACRYHRRCLWDQCQPGGAPKVQVVFLRNKWCYTVKCRQQNQGPHWPALRWLLWELKNLLTQRQMDRHQNTGVCISLACVTHGD